MRQDEELGNGKLSVRGMETAREHSKVLRETRQKDLKEGTKETFGAPSRGKED